MNLIKNLVVIMLFVVLAGTLVFCGVCANAAHEVSEKSKTPEARENRAQLKKSIDNLSNAVDSYERATSTSCGASHSKPNIHLDGLWAHHTCKSKAAAGDNWDACLNRKQYTKLGIGCPGQQRCCPR